MPAKPKAPVSQEKPQPRSRKAAPAPEPLTAPALRFFGAGFFRDESRTYLAEDGRLYQLEWTPTLNAEELQPAALRKLITGCKAEGGGWQVPTRAEQLTLVSTQHHTPATFPALAGDTRCGWYLTADKAAWSSGHVWFVGFFDGSVRTDSPGDDGFARGVRRVPVSPGQ